MKKTKVKMNKPVYLRLSVLEISKTLMHEFWYDCIKPKYSDNVKLCNMDTDSFIMHIKTEDFYKDIANDAEKRFDASNYEVNRPLLIGNNKKMINERWIRRKDSDRICCFKAKHLTDGYKEDKKAKVTKKCVIKRRFKLNDYKDCLLNNKIVLKSQQRLKSERHDLYTEDINKIPLSSSDDKRLQTFDRITLYTYGASAGKVCKTELLSKVITKWLILIMILMKIK